MNQLSYHGAHQSRHGGKNPPRDDPLPPLLARTLMDAVGSSVRHRHWISPKSIPLFLTFTSCAKTFPRTIPSTYTSCARQASKDCKGRRTEGKGGWGEACERKSNILGCVELLSGMFYCTVHKHSRCNTFTYTCTSKVYWRT